MSPMSAAAFHVLLALSSQDLHGYGIIQEIARHSDGHYRPGPGTLYDNLKKLMESGLVADAPKSAMPEDEERRFYTLTEDGRSALAVEVNRLQKVVREARSRLREVRPKRV